MMNHGAHYVLDDDEQHNEIQLEGLIKYIQAYDCVAIFFYFLFF